MLVLPHAVTAGASLGFPSLYIELITGKQPSRLDLISILALSLVFHAITLERSRFRKIPTVF